MARCIRSIRSRIKADGNSAPSPKRLRVEFNLEDVGQLIAGAFVMALPLALAEEVWDLGASLSTTRIMMIFLLSVITLAIFVWALFYGNHAAEYKGHFLRRVVTAYLVTFLVSLILLMLFDKAPLDDPGLAINRAIIVAFPVAFAATAVDFINKRCPGHISLSQLA
jgi:uncharacterized membrane protein